MVPALNPTGQDSPRTGVPAYLRGEILTPLPGDGPSLYDPLTGARRGTDVAGRSMRQNRDLRRPDNGRGCRHVTADLRRCRVRPDARPAPDRASPHLRRLSRLALRIETCADRITGAGVAMLPLTFAGAGFAPCIAESRDLTLRSS